MEKPNRRKDLQVPQHREKRPATASTKARSRLRLVRSVNRRARASKPIIYLAAPYTDPSAAVRADRFQRVNAMAAGLAASGKIVFSPVTMTHPLDTLLAGNGETLGTDYWLEYDEAFLSICKELWVLCIPGWEHSKGVQREIEYFKRRGRKIRYIDEDGKEMRNYVDAARGLQ